MRKLLLIVVIGLVLYGISQNPNQWATAGEGLGDQLASIADGFGTFFTRLLT